MAKQAVTLECSMQTGRPTFKEGSLIPRTNLFINHCVRVPRETTKRRCMCMCACMRVCMCACMCACVCVYKDIHDKVLAHTTYYTHGDRRLQAVGPRNGGQV